jgi:hypothetical protein
MTFDVAVKQPFTNEHQHSLQNRRRNNITVVDGDVSLGEREIRTSSEAETNKVKTLNPKTSLSMGLFHANIA